MEGGNYIQKNWQNLVWIVGLVFAAGGAYSEFKTLHKEQEVIKREQDEIREQVFKEIEQRVDNLEEQKAYQDGFNEGIRKQK
jgi:hypothetical protein